MSIFSKIINPKAKVANIVLAVVYIAVIISLFIGAMMWQFSSTIEK